MQIEQVRTEKLNLTNFDAVRYLLEHFETGKEAQKMRGTVRVKGKCPQCDNDFIHVKRLGYICERCKILPTRFFIDLWWKKGERIRLFSDKSGLVLDSYQRAQTLLSIINAEIKNNNFNPAQYIKAEIKKFWTMNLLDNFLQSKLDSIAPSYKKDYIRINKIARDYFKTTDIREIKKLDIIRYEEYLEKNFSFAPKTIKNILDLFKTFLRYCESDIQIINIVPDFPKIQMKQNNFKWLSQEDQIELLELVPDKHRPIIAFLMLHGCRPGEARAIRCRDIDLRSQTITISATFSGRVLREQRKGKGANNYTIPIHSEMLDYITERVKSSLPLAFLFINKRTGKHYSQDALNRIWDNVRKKAGIDKTLRLYDATRHSFASQLVNSGSSIYKISKLLGHSSVEMTEKYTHHNIDSLRTDMNKLSLKKVIELKETVTRASPEVKSLVKNA